MPMIPRTAKLYLTLSMLAGGLVLVSGLSHWQCPDPVRFACYLLIALLASTFRVSLPGITGTISVNYLFILVGVVELSLGETLVLGCASTLIECLWRHRKRTDPVQTVFNVSRITLAIGGAYVVFRLAGAAGAAQTLPVALTLASVVFFCIDSVMSAGLTAVTHGFKAKCVWRGSHLKSLGYYLIGSFVVVAVTYLNRAFGWEVALLILPVILERMESGRTHAVELGSLHLRTVEALALAIEAKDDKTHAHLKRVQVYAYEIGKELDLATDELRALQAAAILHDIGKLAVPEHIISKPGKLTPEEFEKMKIHPVIGAQILSRVEFPYPVVPIVRSHHEKWDGSGYPDGLKREEIPLGARILSAVDCLDALASDRQYRRALPLHKAMEAVEQESGKSFDPRVVEVLARRYRQLEEQARAAPEPKPHLDKDVRVERGLAPAAGFERVESRVPIGGDPAAFDFLSSIASARQEAQLLFELTQDLGSSLSLHETLSVLAIKLKRIIPHDAIAIFIRRQDKLLPEFVSGENFRLFSSLEIPMGEGLSGWVAENRKPILNGNPSVEPGYLNDPTKFSTLNSALALPLEGVEGVFGAIALYHHDKDAFSRDHLRVMLALNSKASLAIENALKYARAERCAATDSLTGLPNARSLFLHLDEELSRARRAASPLAVLVCDLDGFKHVNDKFGHLHGNKVLARVSQGLRECCREYDYVARMGGDEFVLVLPGITPEAVGSKESRIAEVVREAGLAECGEDLLAVSIGVAFHPDEGDDAEQLLASADRRMYKQKQQHKGTALVGAAMPELRSLRYAVQEAGVR